MRRSPRVVIGESRSETSTVTELLSNVYTTVIPPSLRGLVAEETIPAPRQICEVLFADLDHQASRIVLGFVQGGFSVWKLSGAKAVELFTEVDCGPVKIAKFLPPLRTSSVQTKAKNATVPVSTADELALMAWGESMPNVTNRLASKQSSDSTADAVEPADLIFVDSRQDNIMKLCNTATGQVTEEVAQPSAIDSIQVLSRMLAVTMKNHSALIYLRDGGPLSSARCIMIPHAHPLVVGSRWVAYGAKLSLEAKVEADTPASSQTTSPVASPQMQSSVWQDLTKSLAVSAFRLGEASSKKITEYLSSNQTSSSSSAEEGDTMCCANDVVIVRDIYADQRLVCKIMDSTSFLTFDDSGSLLLSASAEGQSLSVYSLPRGQLLYTLERGLRPARIVHACFSPDRHWIAVTSNRGTTHLFPVHPTGTRASVSTHHKPMKDTAMSDSGMGRFVASVLGSPMPSKDLKSKNSPAVSSVPTAEPKYMMDVHGGSVPVVPSLAKICTPSNLLPIRAVRFVQHKIIRIVCQTGIVEDFSLATGITSASDKDESDKLCAEVKVFRGFDLSRPVGESLLPADKGELKIATPPPPAKVASPNPNHVDSFEYAVSNFEVNASAEPLVPIWASPQFALIQTTSDSDARSELESIFFTPTGSILQAKLSVPPPGLADAIRTPAFDNE